MLRKYDFHVHTSRFSPCAHNSPEEICSRATKIGLAGIALTEHDTWWPRQDLLELRKKFPGLTILDGVEISCHEGHFLVFLPDSAARFKTGVESILELRQLVDSHGGIIIWAHPFRYSKTIPSWLESVKPDAMEVSSSNMNGEVSVIASKVAREQRIPGLKNSDAHHVDTLGKFYNELEVRISENEDLIRMIRKSKS